VRSNLRGWISNAVIIATVALIWMGLGQLALLWWGLHHARGAAPTSS
jgi:hypothetical protein